MRADVCECAWVCVLSIQPCSQNDRMCERTISISEKWNIRFHVLVELFGVKGDYYVIRASRVHV